MVSPLWVVDMDGIPLEGCEQRLPLGAVVEMVVSPVSVVKMVYCRTPSVTGNIHLTTWCGWWVVDLKSSPPPLGMEHSLAGFGIVPPWKLRLPLARLCSFPLWGGWWGA
jgi:hypothetical protein